MRNLEELKIWQKGIDLVVKYYRLITLFPNEQTFGLCPQIMKAAISIPSNIAEGIGRSSEKDRQRFVAISPDSAYELETQLLIAQSLHMGDTYTVDKLLTDIAAQQKMTIGFMNKLNK